MSNSTDLITWTAISEVLLFKIYIIMITKIRKFSMLKNIMYCYFLITIIAVLNITKPNRQNHSSCSCSSNVSFLQLDISAVTIHCRRRITGTPRIPCIWGLKPNSDIGHHFGFRCFDGTVFTTHNTIIQWNVWLRINVWMTPRVLWPCMSPCGQHGCSSVHMAVGSA